MALKSGITCAAYRSTWKPKRRHISRVQRHCVPMMHGSASATLSWWLAALAKPHWAAATKLACFRCCHAALLCHWCVLSMMLIRATTASKMHSCTPTHSGSCPDIHAVYAVNHHCKAYWQVPVDSSALRCCHFIPELSSSVLHLKFCCTCSRVIEHS